MTRRNKDISVRVRKRHALDIKRLSHALLVVAAQQAAAEAAAQKQHEQRGRRQAS